MCTAIAFNKDCFYFGRTLDYELSYGEKIVITPRNFCFDFGEAGKYRRHFSMIGMASVYNGYPLYYEAINEKGLGMAGLNFVDNAVYGTKTTGKYAIAPHEFIPFVLGRCNNISEAKTLLPEIRLENRTVSDDLPAAQLHWIISDKSGSVVVESTEKGMFVYDDPAGILTNNPEFPSQLIQLNNYMCLTAKPPQNNFCSSMELKPYSRGMGAIGLPGDWSSESRFARAAFVKMNSVSGNSEAEAVTQYFRMMNAVAVPKGCCDIGDGSYQITRYICCCNCDKGIFYYTTYDNHRITAVHLHHENPEKNTVICYEPISKEQILNQN